MTEQAISLVIHRAKPQIPMALKTKPQKFILLQQIGHVHFAAML